jgi:gliding motility-associated-like protein
MYKVLRLIVFISAIFIMVDGNSQVVINEYSCANSTSAGDPDFFGEMEDWVELYNTTGAAINLNGYYLSDKASNPTKFQVPGNISIPANGYMMIYASGRAQIAGGTEIHTNFKLTQTKFEKIILSDAGGTIIDSLTINPTQHLHSRGRTTDGAATWSLFTNSTPNAANASPQLEYAPLDTMNVIAGFYTSSQTVTLSSPDPNVTIYYTTNGFEPTTSSTLYSGPITISSTQVLRARGFSSTPNTPPSFIETNTYFINSSHTVPVVSICGDQVMTLLNGSQIEPDGSVEFFDRAGIMQTEVTGTFDKHGNDSWAYNQRGIDFVARDQYGYNYALKHKLFANKSRKKFQRVIFKAGASDNYPFEGTPNTSYPGELGGAHIRDAYVQALSQNGNLLLDERTYDACILYVNGQYWGVYETREKVDDNDFLDYYYGQDEQYKDSPNYIQYLKTWGGTWEKFGQPNAQNDWDALVNYITSNSMAVPANFTYVTSQYKWKSLIDYMVLNSYIVNHDMLNWNTSWWRGLDTTGSKLKWRYSLWDMDATFNHYTNYTNTPNTGANADPCDIDNLPNPGGQGHTVILNALMANPTFKQYYISRYIDLSNTTFKCTNMIAVLDSLINIITPEMPGQIAKWGGTMAQWNQNVQDLRTFINDRCAAINQGLIGCYNLTGPYPLDVNVNPVGAGEVQVNSITPASYVYTGNYFGNIDILLKATDNPGYIFDHWEIFNHTLDSAITNRNNSVQITQGDSIIAHYILVGDTINLTFNVDPVGSGDISIDGFTPATYSYSNIYPQNSTLTLVATPQPGFVFDYWESTAAIPTVFTPNANDPNAQMIVNEDDSIVAHFLVLDTFDIEYRVSPILMGQIDIDSNMVYEDTTTISVIKQYISGTNIDLLETPISNMIFDHWESLHHTLTPSTLSSSVSFSVSGNDVITAVYIEEVLPPEKGAAVPMAFSPNGDGNNDFLFVYGGQIERLTFEVYDRWGEKVFSTSSQDKGWDGTYNGKDVNSGVYVYKLKAVFTDGDIENKTGNITLIR